MEKTAIATFIITDTHFGVRQNSITWLNSQLEFIYKQLIPHIKDCKKNNLEVTLIHMGDVFDSRSTISTATATKIVSVFKDLSELCDVHIIAGNHDFYSPNSDEIDTLSLLLQNTGAHLHIKDSYILNDCVFIPWYQWGSEESKRLVEKSTNIFTHADIVTEKIPYSNLKNKRIFSGHIHIPYIKGNLYNIGSCYALNFADANQPRGYYTMQDNESPIFHPNKYSIKFWRLYNEDIFDEAISRIANGDYVEMYISKSNMLDPKYIDQINKATKTLKNLWVIPQPEDIRNEDLEKFEGYDMDKMIKNMIPIELREKFNQILNNK